MAILKKNNSTAKAPKKAEKKETAAETKAVSFAGNSVIVRPLVTEKSAVLASKNAYVFAVAKNATKVDISMAIRAMYGVQPESVNVSNVRGKVVRRGKVTGQRKAWKKAIVTLPAGKSLNIYEGV